MYIEDSQYTEFIYFNIILLVDNLFIETNIIVECEVPLIVQSMKSINAKEKPHYLINLLTRDYCQFLT